MQFPLVRLLLNYLRLPVSWFSRWPRHSFKKLSGVRLNRPPLSNKSWICGIFMDILDFCLVPRAPEAQGFNGLCKIGQLARPWFFLQAAQFLLMVAGRLIWVHSRTNFRSKLPWNSVPGTVFIIEVQPMIVSTSLFSFRCDECGGESSGCDESGTALSDDE